MNDDFLTKEVRVWGLKQQAGNDINRRPLQTQK